MKLWTEVVSAMVVFRPGLKGIVKTALRPHLTERFRRISEDGAKNTSILFVGKLQTLSEQKYLEGDLWGKKG